MSRGYDCWLVVIIRDCVTSVRRPQIKNVSDAVYGLAKIVKWCAITRKALKGDLLYDGSNHVMTCDNTEAFGEGRKWRSFTLAAESVGNARTGA